MPVSVIRGPTRRKAKRMFREKNPRAVIEKTDYVEGSAKTLKEKGGIREYSIIWHSRKRRGPRKKGPSIAEKIGRGRGAWK